MAQLKSMDYGYTHTNQFYGAIRWGARDTLKFFDKRVEAEESFEKMCKTNKTPAKILLIHYYKTQQGWAYTVIKSREGDGRLI